MEQQVQEHSEQLDFDAIANLLVVPIEKKKIQVEKPKPAIRLLGNHAVQLGIDVIKQFRLSAEENLIETQAGKRTIRTSKYKVQMYWELNPWTVP